MPVHVVAYRPQWAEQYDALAATLRAALHDVPTATVEHVGSTSVPGLAAKPVLDVDVVVEPADVPAAVAALAAVGYVHRGDLGLPGREAFWAPDDDPRRHVYVCRAGDVQLRNHLAVRDVLRERDDLRDQYAAVKLALAADPAMDIDTYTAGKSAVLQQVLAASALVTADERCRIEALNTGAVSPPPVPDREAPSR